MPTNKQQQITGKNKQSQRKKEKQTQKYHKIHNFYLKKIGSPIIIMMCWTEILIIIIFPFLCLHPLSTTTMTQIFATSSVVTVSSTKWCWPLYGRRRRRSMYLLMFYVVLLQTGSHYKSKNQNSPKKNKKTKTVKHSKTFFLIYFLQQATRTNWGCWFWGLVDFY